MLLDRSRFPDIISELDRFKFKTKVQAEFIQLSSSNAYLILKIAKESRTRTTKQKEQVIIDANDVGLIQAYMSATEMKSWPEAEEVIATDAHASFAYAALEDKPFPLGEPVIATIAKASYVYASDILHHRFKLGEEVMKQRPNIWEAYTEEFANEF